MDVGNCIGRSMLGNVGNDWLNYVTENYSGQPRLAISENARSAACRCRIMATKECLYSGHAAVKRSAMGVIIPTRSVKLSRGWMFIDAYSAVSRVCADQKVSRK